MAFDVAEFVVRAGLGLEAEDRLLLGSHLVHGTHGGLLRLINERYFQFIVWRALTPKYSVKVEAEGNIDLVVSDGDARAIFEMKRWFSSGGQTEIPSIDKDIDKLLGREADIRGMILFSANDRGKSQENFLWLEARLDRLKSAQRHVYLFDTKYVDGKDKEFWLALWLV